MRIRCLLFVAGVLAWNVTAQAPVPRRAAPRQVRSGLTAPSKPAGLLFFATYRLRDNAEAVANPYIAGALHTIYWSDVEKRDGVYDWTDLDRRTKPWLAAGKKIALRIMWSSNGRWPEPAAKSPTPQWVLQQGAAVAVSQKTETQVPLFWDPVYIGYSQRFLREVANRFDGDPSVLFIDATPGAETNPYRFGMDSSEPAFRERFKKTPSSDGRIYSDDLWLLTAKEYMDAAAETFKRTKLLVTLNLGSIDTPTQFNEIGSHAVSKGFYVGQNGLNGGSYRDESPRRSAFLAWGQTTRLYFEMVARAGERTGTLMEVMEAAGRIGCDFLGVYDSDVLKGTRGQADFDPAYEAALRYGASVVGQEQIP